jgi:predicted RNA binding protein YcfA (HicA-like mRNA interferase family)
MDIKGYKSNRIRISRRDLIQYIESLGYMFERQSKTKHEIYKHKETNKCIPVSITRGRDVKPGIVSAILKETGTSRIDLIKFLHKL